MFSKVKYRIRKEHQVAAVGFGVAAAIAIAAVMGAFEALEIGILDRFVRMRASAEAEIDDRFLVVTVGEGDIDAIGQWPISDATVASLVKQLNKHGPEIVGIDLFRNLPIEPGVDELIKTLEEAPNVVGIERVVGQAVPPHRTLEVLGQSAAADVVVDDDGRIRRGLLSLIAPDGEVKEGLAARLALDYLSVRGIEPEMLDDRGLSLRLGEGRVDRFEKNDGGYVNADEGGFQVLMNYRGRHSQFETVSITSVLAGEVTEAQVRDRIVLIGSTAISLNDLFYTPISTDQQIAGIYIHAYMISQLLDTALEGSPLLRTVPNYAEWLWTLGWVMASIAASRSMLRSRSLKSEVSAWQMVIKLLAMGGGLSAVGYGLFLAGWWLPIALPMVAMGGTMALGLSYQNQQLQSLAAFDELTQVANRRYFDQHLLDSMKGNRQLSLILCDVDYFKAYNDLYGHPAGDKCLYQVAQALSLAVRDSDMVARYGGEEFVVVLPNATADMTKHVADRIQQQVRSLEIVHEGSQVSEWVTLSCGVADVSINASLSPLQLVEYADQALYEAKQQGRNRVVLSQWKTAAGGYKEDAPAQCADDISDNEGMSDTAAA